MRIDDRIENEEKKKSQVMNYFLFIIKSVTLFLQIIY